MAGALLLSLLLPIPPLAAATLTVTTDNLGHTPGILAYNSGHFYLGSNTREWWRYAGVNGARLFISPSAIEPSDDLSPVGDGVTNEASFLARKAALRADPLNTNYINWVSISIRYQSTDLYPNNHIRLNYALGELRKLGVQVCAQITASQSRLPVADSNDWGNMWELWQHYYAQAFYLGRNFDVQRYQMFNEPNHSSANGLTQTNFLLRLQLASDAIQSALADVNSLYGKALVPTLLAPVTSGSAAGSYPDWGRFTVTNRHVNFLGQTDPNWFNVQVYDYHQYDSSPSSFGSSLASLNNLLAADMAPEPRYRTAISEFNTRTGATYDGMTQTLDTPTEYSRFGAIVVNLMSNACDELYAFKFSQTEYTGDFPVQKNAMHYVDNTNFPYNVGGITKAGEVWRLFNKAFATGRDRLGVQKGTGATTLDVHASYDPVRQRYYLFSVNNTAGSVSADLNLANWNVPPGNRVLLEEVSETCHGGGVLWTAVPTNRIISGVQGSNTVWLVTIPRSAQLDEQTAGAVEDGEVRDGVNRGVNYGAAASMVARNDPADTGNRSAAFMKFDLSGIALTNLEFAVLSLQAATVNSNATVQAHVYGLDTNVWSQGTICWSNAPNLRQGVAAGNTIARQVVSGVGDTARLLGQVVVTSTNASEKLIDVTEWVRGRTNPVLTVLVSQDPRWDVTLPSLAAGDTQAAGVKIVTTEGGTGPALKLVLKQANNGSNNTPPVAVNDSAVTTRDTPVVVNVLANDSDGDGDTIAIQSFTQGASGSVSNQGKAALVYSPSNGFTGGDSFAYTIVDGQGGSNTATVTVTVNPPGGSSGTWTNVTVATEAFVRGGAYANSNQDEVATGYLMVKYNDAPFDTARKAYFQFDLTGLDVDLNTQAVFTVTTHSSTYTHRVQLWGLNQGYPGFNSDLTWNSAQANETNSNDLLTSGNFTASAIGADQLLSSLPATACNFVIPRIGDFMVGDRVTLVLAGVDDVNNNSGGLRLARTNARLQVLVGTLATTNVITGIDYATGGSVTITFTGEPNQTVILQAATNLATGTGWQSVSTNIVATNGIGSGTDFQAVGHPRRFYRIVGL